MEQYSDDLVELANQAWILNCALAELYRFKKSVQEHIQIEPSVTRHLQRNFNADLIPAIARLKTRLDALLLKWIRRLKEQSQHLQTLSVHDEPWGCRIDIPAYIRQQMQVEETVDMSMKDIQLLAQKNPDDFFVFYERSVVVDCVKGAGGISADVHVIRFTGVQLNVSRMWWSWWFESSPLCRLEALTGNLWKIDPIDF